MPPLPFVPAESKMPPACGRPCPAARLGQVFSIRKTLPSTSGFDLKSATSDRHLSRPDVGSRPLEPVSPVQQAPSRIFASFQARFSGTCRTSTRLGLKRENGRRQSVFSFSIRKAALGLDCCYCLSEQLLRTRGSQRIGCGRNPIDVQPDQFTHAPLQVNPVHFSRKQRRRKLILR